MQESWKNYQTTNKLGAEREEQEVSWLEAPQPAAVLQGRLSKTAGQS